MAKVLIEEQNLSDIATSIRSKNGTETTYKPGQMATAIAAIDTVNNQNKTVSSDGTYTADSGYTGLGEVVVSTGAAGYKQTATNWGNAIARMSYYLAGNWGEPEPHTYTYEELLQLAPIASQTVTEGITDVQTAKYKLNQIITALRQLNINPSYVPQLQGDRIQKFVDAIISQVNPATQLESKSETITTNGTTTITPTSGKYGMSSVTVTTNVSGGVSEYYDSLGSNKNNIISIIKKLPIIDCTGKTQFSFSNAQYLTNIEGLSNTSGLTKCSNMFYECYRLKEIPQMDTSNVTNMKMMFYGCASIVEIPQINTSKVTTMNMMFYASITEGQYDNRFLTTIPLLDTSSVSASDGFNQMLYGRTKLTDTSLDNILQMCINATNYTGTKTLRQLGINNYYYALSRFEVLPHWQDFLNAGWTYGY